MSDLERILLDIKKEGYYNLHMQLADSECLLSSKCPSLSEQISIRRASHFHCEENNGRITGTVDSRIIISVDTSCL